MRKRIAIVLAILGCAAGTVACSTGNTSNNGTQHPQAMSAPANNNSGGDGGGGGGGY